MSTSVWKGHLWWGSHSHTNDFLISIGLHQGLALSPYLFALVMDELTTKIYWRWISWHMLFAYDIVLVDETKKWVNAKSQIWREALKSKVFKISENKFKCMKCEFSNNRSRNIMKWRSNIMRYYQKVNYFATYVWLLPRMERWGMI